jgi:uncharacterized protein
MRLPTETERLGVRQRPRSLWLVMYQRWEALLFLHWACDPSLIQQTLPSGLTVDTFQNRAYLGVVPFFMRKVRPRFCPQLLGISEFLELNLRTYVFDSRGIPGVWFYSLDANQWLAVQVARRAFQLPYFHARMRAEKDKSSGEITYSALRSGSPESLGSKFRYRAAGEIRRAEPGSLEFFLIERYVLFASLKCSGILFGGKVHHTPYGITNAEVPEWSDSVFELDGFERPARAPDHILMSPGVDVEVFAIERIR